MMNAAKYVAATKYVARHHQQDKVKKYFKVLRKICPSGGNYPSKLKPRSSRPDWTSATVTVAGHHQLVVPATISAAQASTD